jgi:hypothetical protein
LLRYDAANREREAMAKQRASKGVLVGGFIGVAIFLGEHFIPQPYRGEVDNAIGLVLLLLMLGFIGWVFFWWVRIRRMRRTRSN